MGWPGGVHGPAGPVLVLLRFASGLTSEEYVTRQGWRQASLERCPLHPKGGCGLHRNGTYARVTPVGTRIARWYCPQGHCTFALLPDCLAARFPGALADIERVVAAVERSPSLAQAAALLRPDDISLPSALRWLRRRLRPARMAFQCWITLWPERLRGCLPRVEPLRAHLGCACVLVHGRALAAEYLHELPRFVGFAPPAARAGGRKRLDQQHMGADPPAQAP
ncbi:putative uncharacterized protein [Burkholderiales bacterium GJ-E10]|nr:putative uncharacterized protein [Burkholderiales bacterium GJ-E10]BAP88020.1 putative uncharacterized protein [Burkholderiales bacterium GJ-E10]BAP88175.1 putative uncharacterized protein [Burkholderiales bacterium GJ-E10]BAP89830.1 putative uncharacterized protein [Burkholderiales bacterium GJ-E10]BAP89844.1 putative uncharacterized protein [Burkholderiales bacterium GJ-E10]